MKLFNLKSFIQHKQWEHRQLIIPTSEDRHSTFFLFPSWFSGIETTEVVAMSKSS